MERSTMRSGLLLSYVEPLRGGTGLVRGRVVPCSPMVEDGPCRSRRKRCKVLPHLHEHWQFDLITRGSKLDDRADRRPLQFYRTAQYQKWLDMRAVDQLVGNLNWDRTQY